MRLLLLASLLVMPPAVVAGPRTIAPDRATGSSGAVVVDDVPLLHTTQLSGQSVKVVLDRLVDLLGEGGARLDDVVKLNLYAAREEVVPAITEELARRFSGDHRPAVTIVVGTPVEPEVLISVDAVAAVAKADAKTVRLLKRGQLAILPAGPVCYVAGQAERGKTLAEATRKTLASLDATIGFLGRKRGDVVQVKAFVHPMTKLAEVRKEIAGFFPEGETPPVTLVEWTSKDSIEIELIVAGGPDREKRTRAVDFLTPPGMTASPIYSRVARIGHGKRIYVSGLVGEGKDGTAQVKDVFARLGRLLKSADSDFGHLVKATYYVSTDDASKQLNLLRPNYYDPKRPPSASKAPVRSVGRKGRGIVVDMIAVVP